MGYFLGIDGGATRTTAWVADARGRVVGRGRAGPSNPVKAGYAAVQREILRAAQAAIRPRRGTPWRAPTIVNRQPTIGNRLEAVVAGLSGADHPTVHRDILGWLRRAIPARRHLLTTDAALVLEAALGEAPGIIVISGTGLLLGMDTLVAQSYGATRGQILRRVYVPSMMPILLETLRISITDAL